MESVGHVSAGGLARAKESPVCTESGEVGNSSVLPLGVLDEVVDQEESHHAWRILGVVMHQTQPGGEASEVMHQHEISEQPSSDSVIRQMIGDRQRAEGGVPLHPRPVAGPEQEPLRRFVEGVQPQRIAGHGVPIRVESEEVGTKPREVGSEGGQLIGLGKRRLRDGQRGDGDLERNVAVELTRRLDHQPEATGSAVRVAVDPDSPPAVSRVLSPMKSQS